MADNVELYEQDPHLLLPLLEKHLPLSLPVYGTIVANIPPACGVNIGWSTPPIPPVHPLKAYATFPEAPSGETERSSWVIIIPMPLPQSDQIRLFSSAETAQPQPLPSSAGYAAALTQINAALKSYIDIYPAVNVVGALNSLWVPGVESVLGGEPRGRCNVFLPEDTTSQAEEGIEGYEVDVGREREAEMFQSTSEIKRPEAYYRARLPWSTVIRTAPSDATSSDRHEAAAMVLTHSDGALGALHTEPEHRRKGLAKWVVQEHLALGRRLLVSPSSPSAGRAGGELAWTVVFKGNAASEGLWFRLGWKVGWECAWVYRAM